MSRPDHPKKFPKIVDTGAKVTIVLSNNKAKKITELATGTEVTFDKNGNPVTIKVIRQLVD